MRYDRVLEAVFEDVRCFAMLVGQYVAKFERLSEKTKLCWIIVDLDKTMQNMFGYLRGCLAGMPPLFHKVELSKYRYQLFSEDMANKLKTLEDLGYKLLEAWEELSEVAKACARDCDKKYKALQTAFHYLQARADGMSTQPRNVAAPNTDLDRITSRTESVSQGDSDQIGHPVSDQWESSKKRRLEAPHEHAIDPKDLKYEVFHEMCVNHSGLFERIKGLDIKDAFTVLQQISISCSSFQKLEQFVCNLKFTGRSDRYHDITAEPRQVLTTVQETFNTTSEVLMSYFGPAMFLRRSYHLVALANYIDDRTIGPSAYYLLDEERLERYQALELQWKTEMTMYNSDQNEKDRLCDQKFDWIVALGCAKVF